MPLASLITANRRQLVANFASLLVLRGFDAVISVITMPYIVHSIGLEQYGLLVFAMSLAAYFGAAMQYGFSVSAVRDLSRARGTCQLRTVYSAALYANILLVGFWTLAFLLVLFAIPSFSANRPALLGAFFFVAMQSLFPAWVFHGLEKMHFVAVITAGAKVGYLVLLFTYVNEPSDFVLVHALNGSTMAVAVIVSYWIAGSQLSLQPCRVQPNRILAVYKDGFAAFVNQFAPTLYNNSAVFLLGLTSNPAAVGAFGAAMAITEATTSVVRLGASSFLPLLSRTKGQHRRFQFLIVPVGVLTTAVAVFAEAIARTLFREHWMAVAPLIRYLSPSVLLVFVYVVYATNFLLLHGHGRSVAHLALSCSIVFCGLAVVLIPLHGLVAAVATIVGGRLAMATGAVVLYRKYQGNS